jgi:hypothetical protein
MRLARLPQASARAQPSGGHPLVVVALHEIFPGELGVAGLGEGGSQVEAQGVGVILTEEVGHLHSGATALGELSTSEGQVFIGKRVESLSS